MMQDSKGVTKLTDLLNRDSCYPIYVKIVDSLPIRDIIALTRTCKSFSKIYQDTLPQQWNINQHLKRWMKDPHSFRSLMARHNALIVGDLALQFFDKAKYPDAVLDIYVDKGASASAFHDDLVEHESYYHCESSAYIPGLYDDLEQVKSYARSDEREVEVRIWLCKAYSNPYLALVRGIAWSTAGVNFITWNKAYSMFPFTTFIQHQYFKLRAHSISAFPNKFKPLRENLEDRGFIPAEATGTTLSPRHGSRIPGDKYTWCIPLDMTGIQPSQTPDYVIENSQFHMLYYPPNKNYYLTANTFSASILRYKFTCSHHWIDSKIDKLTFLEMEKLSPEDRPDDYERRWRAEPHPGMGSCCVPKRIPDSWTYYDEEIPRWYEIWEKAVREELLLPG